MGNGAPQSFEVDLEPPRAGPGISRARPAADGRPSIRDDLEAKARRLATRFPVRVRVNTGPISLTQPGLSNAQVLQILDCGPHLASVPRRPVVAFRQSRNTGAAAHGDQLDHQMLRAVVLAQGQEPLCQRD